MTALEKIKEISDGLDTPNAQYWSPTRLDAGFLLKAFRVMREIALHLRQDLNLATSLNRDEDKCKINVDQEFEKRMAEPDSPERDMENEDLRQGYTRGED